MTIVGIAPYSAPFDLTYLTLAEYKNAPTSIDFNNLVVGGNASAQDAELSNMILRASSFMDEYLNQNLNASLQTETQRIRATPEGYLAVHPFNSPIISLNNFAYGGNPNGLVVLNDCSGAWFEDEQIIIPINQIGSSTTTIGALSFSGGGAGRNRLFCRYSYVAGFVDNLIQSATAGASFMTVQDGTGVTPGMSIRMYDGASSETATVSSAYVYGSLTIPFTAPLTFSHTSGVAFGNMPGAVKQACILATTAFIKARGDGAMTMAITTSASKAATGANVYGDDLATALIMLSQYRRIR